jgi:hypothetical protein
LGPEPPGAFHFLTVFSIYAASALYGWIWHEIALKVLNLMCFAFKKNQPTLRSKDDYHF